MGEPGRPRPLNGESIGSRERKQHELADTRETGWSGARSISEGIENNGGTGNPDTAKATGAATIVEKLIANGGIGALTHDRGGSG
jgi:hypothetical protein